MRAKKVDDNQKEIVSTFRSLGFSVAVTSSLGNGFPDIVCGRNGKNYIIEIKDGSKPPSKRKLTPDEEAFKLSWKGQYDIIESVEDVLAFERVCK